MTLSEGIQQHVQRLPVSFQAKVLDFVEYLVARAEREAARQEKRSWSSLSLSFAMRGMKDEDAPLYDSSDLSSVLMKQAGQIVLFRFPQTDLEEGKLRPALLLGRLPVTTQVKTSEVCDRHSAHCDRRKRPGFHA